MDKENLKNDMGQSQRNEPLLLTEEKNFIVSIFRRKLTCVVYVKKIIVQQFDKEVQEGLKKIGKF